MLVSASQIFGGVHRCGIAGVYLSCGGTSGGGSFTGKPSLRNKVHGVFSASQEVYSDPYINGRK